MKFPFIKSYRILMLMVIYCTLLSFLRAEEEKIEPSLSATNPIENGSSSASDIASERDEEIAKASMDDRTNVDNLVVHGDGAVKLEPSVVVQSSFDGDGDNVDDVAVQESKKNLEEDESGQRTTNDASDIKNVISMEPSHIYEVTENPTDVVQEQLDRPALVVNDDPDGDAPKLEVPSSSTALTSQRDDGDRTNSSDRINAINVNNNQSETATVEDGKAAIVDEERPQRAEDLVDKNETLGASSSSSNNVSEQTDVNFDAIALDVVPNQLVVPKSNFSGVEQPVKPEDIPSFSEWAQKQLEVAERERAKNHTPSNGVKGGTSSYVKLRSKNYASPDCGAKIVAANPESVSSNAVLSPTRDEYLLNTCTSRIWFVVELCEAVQAKRIDLANFELFSSSPKDFTVSISDRFPTREWSNVGNFAARDERDIQTFDLNNEHQFGKYVKVEMHSHHGSEHYCPISLFRVYGTSEFEVLEKEDEAHLNSANAVNQEDDDDDDDETLDDNGVPSRNLFSSATDAVISIVRKAAEVLGNNNNRGNASNQTGDAAPPSPLSAACTSLKHAVICEDCDETTYGRVYELLSCRSNLLRRFAAVPFVRDALTSGLLCDARSYGTGDASSSFGASRARYLRSLLPSYYVIALCNVVAVLENRAVVNVSERFPNMTEDVASRYSNSITNVDSIDLKSTAVSMKPLLPATKSTTAADVTLLLSPPTEELKSDVINLTAAADERDSVLHNVINPTKTLQPEDLANNTKEAMLTLATVLPTVTESGESMRPIESIAYPIETNETADASSDFTTESAETNEESLDKLLSDAFNGDASQSSTQPSVAQQQQQQAQKESVFLRLSNRIKALERNMSLSSQYLEELSRRYKKQVEDMQRLLESTVIALKEENKRKDAENRELRQQLAQLTETVDALVAERSGNWVHVTYWLFLVAIATVGLLTICRRSPDHREFVNDVSKKGDEVKRRKSIDVVTHATKPAKVRRPSEEALKISGSYQHLMVDEIDGRKRRRKKKSLQRRNSITTLSEEEQQLQPFQSSDEAAPNGQGEATKTVHNTNNNNNSKKSGNRLWSRQESAPSKLSPNDWIESQYMSYRDKVYEDVPFLLEESEHTSLEPLPYELATNKGEKQNGNSGNSPLFNVPSLPYIRTAINARLKRTPSNASSASTVGMANGNKTGGNGGGNVKTASLESIRESSEVSSVNSGSIVDEKSASMTKKKGALKRLLKKVF